MKPTFALVKDSASWLSTKCRAGLVCCSLVLLIFAPLVSGTGVQGPSLVYYTEPQSLTVRQGDIFNINVLIGNIPADPGLSAAEFHLSWDPIVLNAISFIKVMFQDNSIGWDELNNTEGHLSYVHALRGGASISGNQTLATITLKAVSQGSTNLHFTFVDACSPDCLSFNCEAIDCYVLVGEGSETNTPIAPTGKPNATYTMSIIAGSVINANTSIPPAVVTEHVPFTVGIEIDNVANMFAWQFGLFWNNSLLNCTNAEIYNPDSWTSTITIGGQIDNNYNSTNGNYFIAVDAGRDATSYYGNITIATLTFNPIGEGTTPLTFGDVEICDNVPNFIEFSTINGSVTVNNGQPLLSNNGTSEPPIPTNNTSAPIGSKDSGSEIPPFVNARSNSFDLTYTVHVAELGIISALMMSLAAIGVLAVRLIKPARTKKQNCTVL